MDKLALQLRKDADDIDVDVSPELDNRIRASLQSVTPETPRSSEPRRSPLFSWASSLTGLAAAVAVIVVLNLDTPGPEPVPVASNQPVLELPELPRLPLKAESAMITSPLQKELEDFQADLEKARQEVSEDVRLGF